MEELIPRLRRAGATGMLTVRADAGFFSWALIDIFGRIDVRFSVTVAMNARIRTAIAAIAEQAWTPIDYPDSGEAAMAETTIAAGSPRLSGVRLVVRRSSLSGIGAGVCVISSGHGEDFLVPNEAEQATLARLVELRQQGLGYLKIATLLNEEGRPTKKGGDWQAMSVRNIYLRAGEDAA